MQQLKAITLIFFFSIGVLASEQPLAFKVRPDGQPNFGIQYSYDVDFTWIFTFATSISDSTLAALPGRVYWSIIDLNQNSLIADWMEIDKKILASGSLHLTEKTIVSALLPNLKMSKIVFGNKSPQGTVDVLFSIPLGPLCQNYASNHFVDLTNTAKKGCEVTAADIPEVQSECEEWKTELLDFVNNKLISCNLAKIQYSKRGCGELVCQ